ncbi:ras guanine nucleotide exchange factor G [Ceratitis capitata]|uniref:ras guanine nucleotide exchange factor G n=1 Tax=Ceratitis capitata TaxID=7213 RepID=UPI000329F621|nr:ras guanine nucleotide exchange factor G [Ceratitis capitata]XP_020714692.1 ras guanine nucleotide exchange factor G [Ceratitis capitata]
MMETFIVLGLCFILYEALDFFQGCMHSSASNNSTDQIEAYRRQLDEQRQQQQQEQFIANLTPLLGAQLLAATSNVSLSPSDSTASIISEQLRAQQQREQLEQLEGASVRSASVAGSNTAAGADNSTSTPALHSSSGLGSTFGSAGGSGSLSVASGSSSGAAFRPAYRSAYESQELYATSSLPRDYYFLQQQQQKNKHSARSLFSKFGASNSDNRIFPETTTALGVPAGVVTQQPVAGANHFDCLLPTTLPASPLAVDLKRAILSKNNYNNKSRNNNKTYNDRRRAPPAVESVQVHGVAVIASPSRDPPNPNATVNAITTTTATTTTTTSNQRNRIASASVTRAHDSDASTSDCESDTSGDSSDSSASASAGSASLASCGEDSDPGLGEEREFGLSNSCSSSHADFREIECERLRRKCVSVKRIYSISEKF